MPNTLALFYFDQDADERCPVVEWLEDLRKQDEKAFAKCAALIVRSKRAATNFADQPQTS